MKGYKTICVCAIIACILFASSNNVRCDDAHVAVNRNDLAAAGIVEDIAIILNDKPKTRTPVHQEEQDVTNEQDDTSSLIGDKPASSYVLDEVLTMKPRASSYVLDKASIMIPANENALSNNSKHFNLENGRKVITSATEPGRAKRVSKAAFVRIMKAGLRGEMSNNGTLGQCSWIAEGYCCSVGVPCCCDKPAGAPGQCSSAAYEYCCHYGTPCVCCSDDLQKKNETANNKPASSYVMTIPANENALSNISKHFNLENGRKVITSATEPGRAKRVSKAAFVRIMKAGLRGEMSNNGTLGQCSWIAEGYCCSVGVPCCCDKPAGAPGQCSSAAYEYCCHYGTPCVCCSDDLQKKNETANNFVLTGNLSFVVLKDKKMSKDAGIKTLNASTGTAATVKGLVNQEAGTPRLDYEKRLKFMYAMTNGLHSINGTNVTKNDTLGNCAWPAKEYCCHIGTKCQCTKPPTSPGQCSETAWGYCCAMGTPCMCAASNLYTASDIALTSVVTFNTATALQVALSFMCIVLLLVGIASCISCIQIHTKHTWEQPDVIDSNVITYKRL